MDLETPDWTTTWTLPPEPRYTILHITYTTPWPLGLSTSCAFPHAPPSQSHVRMPWSFLIDDMGRLLRGRGFDHLWVQNASSHCEWRGEPTPQPSSTTSGTQSLRGGQIAEWIPDRLFVGRSHMEMLDQAHSCQPSIRMMFGHAFQAWLHPISPQHSMHTRSLLPAAAHDGDHPRRPDGHKRHGSPH